MVREERLSEIRALLAMHDSVMHHDGGAITSYLQDTADTIIRELLDALDNCQLQVSGPHIIRELLTEIDRLAETEPDGTIVLWDGERIRPGRMPKMPGKSFDVATGKWTWRSTGDTS